MLSHITPSKSMVPGGDVKNSLLRGENKRKHNIAMRESSQSQRNSLLMLSELGRTRLWKIPAFLVDESCSALLHSLTQFNRGGKRVKDEFSWKILRRKTKINLDTRRADVKNMRIRKFKEIKIEGGFNSQTKLSIIVPWLCLCSIPFF